MHPFCTVRTRLAKCVFSVDCRRESVSSWTGRRGRLNVGGVHADCRESPVRCSDSARQLGDFSFICVHSGSDFTLCLMLVWPVLLCSVYCLETSVNVDIAIVRHLLKHYCNISRVALVCVQKTVETLCYLDCLSVCSSLSGIITWTNNIKLGTLVDVVLRWNRLGRKHVKDSILPWVLSKVVIVDNQLFMISDYYLMIVDVIFPVIVHIDRLL